MLEEVQCFMNETTTPASEVLPESNNAARQLTVEQALLSRRSVRAFSATPVPRSVVERLLELAARSASNSNCQPWQVHVVTGSVKARLTAALLAAHDTDGRVRTREYDYQPKPDEWPEPFHTRRRQFGEGLYGGALGIAPTDAEARLAHHRRNYDFFGAPVGLIVTVSRHPLAGALVDAGLFLQALILAARGIGLDTCPQASFIDFYPVLRQQLDIPEDHIIVCGLALGYADRQHKLNGHSTSREPVTSFARFYGDDGAP
ncbi:nitroreductase [Rhodococcus wratislaviensis]|uniref:Nitroreductase n=1 Tax=Rhodococcus wratislaviensis TaxID=44752 RepID=A0AB38F7S5_RHOWR|nr:nitroreductase [Rhodococcus wratislaviensis]REE77460.1 nitroreductase [Rhodococcus wratislaviensis]SPZ35465.1 nitroreductase [Rhodococcus wratislaviensis]